MSFYECKNCGGAVGLFCTCDAKPKTQDYDTLMADYREVVRQRDRLQRIIDSRPAINAGLPQTYIEWSQSIYAMDFSHATETKQ